MGRIVQVGQRQGTLEIWAGDERIAVHPRALREAVASQIPAGEVERRSLDVYELAALGGTR